MAPAALSREIRFHRQEAGLDVMAEEENPCFFGQESNPGPSHPVTLSAQLSRSVKEADVEVIVIIFMMIMIAECILN